MTPLTRLRRYEMSYLLARAGWPQSGRTDTPTSPALAAAVLGISVTTLRRLEADPWQVTGRHLWRILRAVNRLGVPWTPDDWFGLTHAETIPIGPPDPSSPYEGEPPVHPVDESPLPLGVSDPSRESLETDENNLTQPLTTYPRQE